MRKSATETQLSNIVVSLSDIQQERERASSPFGPVRAGLITLQITQHQQLSELLNYLESEVEMLVSKSFEVLDTFSIVTPTQLASHFTTQIEKVGIDENWS